MAIVEISPSLEKEIHKQFKKQSIHIFEYLKSLEEEPKKGKPLARVGSLIIKELKHEGFRFYFVTDAYKVRFYKKEELAELIIRFLRMSDKKRQQKVIEELEQSLLALGPEDLL